jgi:ankyrin repeat protein
VECLLDQGADIEARGEKEGDTAPIWAASKGHMEVVECLVDRGADIEARSVDGFTALTVAAHHGQQGVVECLLDRGANYEAIAVDGSSAYSRALQEGRNDIAELLKHINSASRHFRKVRRNPAIRKILEGMECDVASTASSIAPLAKALSVWLDAVPIIAREVKFALAQKLLHVKGVGRCITAVLGAKARMA